MADKEDDRKQLNDIQLLDPRSVISLNGVGFLRDLKKAAQEAGSREGEFAEISFNTPVPGTETAALAKQPLPTINPTPPGKNQPQAGIIVVEPNTMNTNIISMTDIPVSSNTKMEALPAGTAWVPAQRAEDVRRYNAAVAAAATAEAQAAVPVPAMFWAVATTTPNTPATTKAAKAAEAIPAKAVPAAAPRFGGMPVAAYAAVGAGAVVGGGLGYLATTQLFDQGQLSPNAVIGATVGGAAIGAIAGGFAYEALSTNDEE